MPVNASHGQNSDYLVLLPLTNVMVEITFKRETNK